MKLKKKYPHIKDEDVTEIFMDGYNKGWKNARKKAIPITWISAYTRGPLSNTEYWTIIRMVSKWEDEGNEI